MKGVVFTEFLDMVDDRFGMETTERIVGRADLPSGGAYTSVGTYDHSEIVSLVVELGHETGIGVRDLVTSFGRHLLTRFRDMYPHFFDERPDLFSFLEHVDVYIHEEVRKLYPNAALPEIGTRRLTDGSLELSYRSNRHMGDLCEGLIAGAIAHYGDGYRLERREHPQEEDKQCLTFLLRP